MTSCTWRWVFTDTSGLYDYPFNFGIWNNGDIAVAKVRWGPFTVSVSVSVCGDTNIWVQLTSMVLFTLNDAKHQRKKTRMLTLTLTVNTPLKPYLSYWKYPHILEIYFFADFLLIRKQLSFSEFQLSWQLRQICPICQIFLPS